MIRLVSATADRTDQIGHGEQLGEIASTVLIHRANHLQIAVQLGPFQFQVGRQRTGIVTSAFAQLTDHTAVKQLVQADGVGVRAASFAEIEIFDHIAGHASNVSAVFGKDKGVTAQATCQRVAV